MATATAAWAGDRNGFDFVPFAQMGAPRKDTALLSRFPAHGVFERLREGSEVSIAESPTTGRLSDNSVLAPVNARVLGEG